MVASGVVAFSTVEYAGFACLGFATLASIGQGIVLVPEFDPVRNRRRFQKQRFHLILLGVAELALLAAVIALSGVENVQERAEYQNIYWLAWVAFGVELLELASEFLAHVVKVEDHHKLRTGYNREARVDPRSRMLMLRPLHSWGFRISVVVVFVSVVLSACFIGFCFFRTKGADVCISRAISTPVLVTWSATAVLCALVVFSALFLARRKWGPARAQCYTSDRWSVFEIVLSMVESLPAIFIMSLALDLLISDRSGGCVTLGRKLGSIGLILELGPVAKAGRQVVSWCWPTSRAQAPSVESSDDGRGNNAELSSSKLNRATAETPRDHDHWGPGTASPEAWEAQESRPPDSAALDWGGDAEQAEDSTVPSRPSREEFSSSSDL